MAWRIRDRSTFDVLRRQGRRSRRGHVTVTYAAVGDEPVARVAYAVGRRAGGAVDRNRLRRRLRAAVSDIVGSLRPGAYLVSAGRDTARLPFEDLKADVTAAMKAASEVARP
ncbi:MAG: ribonuclease P protein component [Acidimicrobiales bacterium]|jgi:ribonuclease P protein component